MRRTREARRAIEAFSEEFGAKCPRAVEKITQDRVALLTF
jgi:hypothetical protein